MKRLLITGPRQAEFDDAPEPDCAADGVVVRAKLTAISTGTELRVYRAIAVDAAGQFLHERIPYRLPFENGYSMVGEIVEIGSDVRRFRVGQRVYVPAPHKELAAMPEDRVIPLPEAIPDEHAVFLNILEVAHRALRQGNPPAGGNVAIVGQGVIGLSLSAYLCAFGFHTAVIDREPSRLAIARQMGVQLALEPRESDAQNQILERFAGEGADVAFEAGSNWAAIRTAMELTRTDGTVVVVSRHTQTPDFNPVGHPLLGKRLKLVTSYGYPPDGDRWDAARSVALTLDLLQSGKLHVAPMITHRFGCDELPQVYGRLDSGDLEIVGAVFDWTR